MQKLVKPANRSVLPATIEGLAATANICTAAVERQDDVSDIMVGGTVTTGTLPVSGTIDIFLYASIDKGVSFTAGVDGVVNTAVAASKTGLLIPVESITVDATSDASYNWGPVNLSSLLGDNVPVDQWGICVENNTATPLNATPANQVINSLEISEELQ